MNLDQLLYVREILRTQSITIASENLHVTQSAISQSITFLEKEVGIPLFHRSRQGTIPTEEGKPILYKILETLQKFDELQEEIQSINSSYIGEMNVATIPSIFMTYLPRMLASFQRDYPQIKVNVVEMENLEIIAGVQQEEIDLGFIALFSTFNKKMNQQTVFHPLQTNGLFTAIVPKNSELALKKFLTIQDIKNYPFIMYDRKFFHEVMEDFQKEVPDINIIFKTSNTEVIKRSVAEGLGISILTNLMLKDDPYINGGAIITVPVRLGWNVQIQFGILHKKNSGRMPLIEKFLENI
jgi:DNA-binding transcriptional LysR family regulator